MAQYTDKQIKDELGSKYDPDSEYLLLTHRTAANRCREDPCLTPVGQLPDFTNTEVGTMIIVKRSNPE